jgi:hypothetical protein
VAPLPWPDGRRSEASCPAPLYLNVSEMPFTKWASYRGLAAPHCMADLEPLELRMVQIQRLILACPKRLRLGSAFKLCAVFPHRVRSIKSMVLSFRALRR